MIKSNYALNGNGSNLNVHSNGHHADSLLDEIGAQHVATSYDTPVRPDAFELSDDEKVRQIEGHFREIMNILGLDLKDDSLRGTPRRVAKMFVKEIFSGLHPDNMPAVSLFDNKFKYRQMLVEKGIRVQSFCEHHFLPIYGRAHIGYIANGKVIGLSKLNRIVEYYARRPQVQERLTIQIANELKKVLGTEDVAVYIDAKHMCVEMRGVQHEHSSTITSEFSGKFLNENVRAEFLQAIR
ncbi:MAG: GTP cyclohydrolase I FolE [Phaeodactylibacter sp.]|nr:GTP cyclohydrolase I FolE [Phaeodactylibacter sp.]